MADFSGKAQESAADQAQFLKSARDGEVADGESSVTRQSKRGKNEASRDNWPYRGTS